MKISAKIITRIILDILNMIIYVPFLNLLINKQLCNVENGYYVGIGFFVGDAPLRVPQIRFYADFSSILRRFFFDFSSILRRFYDLNGTRGGASPTHCRSTQNIYFLRLAEGGHKARPYF